MARRKRPFVITILAIAQLISALQFFLLAMILLVLSGRAEGPQTLILLIALVLIVMSVWYLFIMVGYLKGRESSRRWGRRAALIAMIIAVLTILLSGIIEDPGTPVLSFIINLFIFVYLGRRKVRAYFSRR